MPYLPPENYYSFFSSHSHMNRRHFLRNSGLGSLPLVTGLTALSFRQPPDALQPDHAQPGLPQPGHPEPAASNPDPLPSVNFLADSMLYTPSEYISKLAEIHKAHPIERDFYATRGTMAELLKKFASITGKEAAIYMPSGTLANQLAIHVLSGKNTKAYVQETSHVYRDEADAAEAVFGKRLVPLAKGQHYFTAAQLQVEDDYIGKEEYFKSPVGAVSIENPVRRCDGRIVPLEEIKNIAVWCKKKGYGLHLDGARLHLASAWSGVSVSEYASHFDTVYMCLYKYLGASAGAILCGEKAVIDQMEHLVKIHGGSMYQNWSNAAMALAQLEGIEDRLKRSRDKATALFAKLNEIAGLKITAIPEGSNIYNLLLASSHDPASFRKTMADAQSIRIGVPDTDGFIKLHVNESLLLRETDSIANAFKTVLG
jgi:threonine aldolase